MGWSYFAQRLVDGGNGPIVAHELPIRGLQLTETLTGANKFSGTISPVYGTLLHDDHIPVLCEWGTAIWAEDDDGEIRGGGILTSSTFNGSEWALSGIGLSGYPDGMPYTDAWFGVEIDPMDVVRKIWGNLQSKKGGNLGLEIDDLKTGLMIGTELKQGEFDTESGPLSFESGPVKLAWYQTHDLGEELANLHADTPLDYREKTWWDGNVLRHKLNYGYPSLGRRRKDLTFIVGENLAAIPSVDRNGEEFANEVLALGAGNGRTMMRGYAARHDSRRRRVAVVTQKQARSQKAANNAAKRDLAWRYNLDDITEVVVRDHPSAAIGSWQVGDEIRVRGELGWRETDMWLRVLTTSVSPDAGDIATLSLLRPDKANLE